MPRFDDFRDKSGERSMRADRLDDVVLKKLLADDYYNSVKIDIRKVEAIVGLSILDIFEDNPVFVKFPKLKGLARSRSFELSYYGRVRGE
jgi:hypothetical protein